jgi:hypothetical protein
MNIKNDILFYKIISKGENYDDKYTYYGSTKNSLNTRFSQHKSNYKKFKENLKCTYTTSFFIFDKYGINNCFIVLIEKIENLTKTERNNLECSLIQNFECVNFYHPGACENIKLYNKLYHRKYNKKRKEYFINYRINKINKKNKK